MSDTEQPEFTKEEDAILDKIIEQKESSFERMMERTGEMGKKTENSGEQTAPPVVQNEQP